MPDTSKGQPSTGRSRIQYSPQDVENLAKLLKVPADKAVPLLDEARRAAELYLHIQDGSSRTPRRAARLVALQRFQKALAKAETTAAGAEFVLAAVEPFEQFKSAVGSLRAIVGLLTREKPTKGPESDFAADWLLGELARLYKQYTGVLAGTAWTVKRGYKGYSGPFFEFVKLCVNPLGLRKSDAALGKAIQRTIKKDRK